MITVVKNLSEVLIRIHIDLIRLIQKDKSNPALDLPKLKLFEKRRCWNKADLGQRNETNFIMVPEDKGRSLSETTKRAQEAHVSIHKQWYSNHGRQQARVPSRESP